MTQDTSCQSMTVLKCNSASRKVPMKAPHINTKNNLALENVAQLSHY